jgi:hypothetical protein
MTAQLSIVAARRGRAAIGRQILGTLAGAVAAVTLLIAPPHSRDGVAAPVPPPVIGKPEASYGGHRWVIAVGQGTRSNRCDIQGFANGVPLTFEIDTGDPNLADFPSSYVGRLGIEGPLDYSERFPDTRFGKVATTTLNEIRIGEVVWDHPEVNVLSNWDYSFGSDEIPLFGLPALTQRGINVEFEKDGRCRLTVARGDRRAES